MLATPGLLENQAGDQTNHASNSIAHKRNSKELVAALKPIVDRVRTVDTAIKLPDGSSRWTDEPLTDARLLAHVEGRQPRGCSPMQRGGTTARIALFDLDSHKGETPWPEMQRIAGLLCSTLDMFGYSPIPFRSSGGHGMHVYLIWDQPQDAHSVRQTLRDMLTSIGYADGAGGVAKHQIEVFPKQDELQASGTGSHGSQFILPLAGRSVPLGATFDPLPREAIIGLGWPMSAPVVHHERKAVVPSTPGEPVSDEQIEHLRSALQHLAKTGRGDDYRNWQADGSALRSLGDPGLPLFVEYSEQCANYKPGGPEAKWPDLACDRTGYAAIFRRAMDAGWVNPRASAPNTAEGFDDHDVVDTPSDGARITIDIRNGERARIVADLAVAMAKGAPYYRRDAMLVRAITLPADEDSAGVHRSRGSVLLRQAKPQAVIADASRVARTVKWDGRSKKMVPCDLPSDVAAAFCELGVEHHVLPSVVGVVRCPVMREDGSLRAARGYDPSTRLILAGDEDWSVLSVPETPSRADASASLQWLLDTAYRDFPFADEESKAVAVSALLTAVIRPAIDCAPLHAFSAPQYGAGKSLQASVASMVATGTKAAMVSPGHSQEEFEKRVDAAVIAGDPVVLLDNLSRPLSGDNLCSSMTSDTAIVRPLGSSMQLRVRTTAFWMATGQNLSVKRDMHRRTVIGYIDAKMERPETRTGFAVPDLVAWVATNRMHILSAVYTMLRAHAQAGHPAGDEKLLGNFEAWSRRVAHCLVWLGLANPVKSQERLRKDDPEVQNKVALFRELLAWQEQRGGKPWAYSELQTDAMWAGPLHDAIQITRTRDGKDGMPYWLRSNKNATVDVDGRACRLGSPDAVAPNGAALWHIAPPA
jgi:putative DNA primase/helicase